MDGPWKKGEEVLTEAEHKRKGRKVSSECTKGEKKIKLSVTIAKVLPLDKVSDNFLSSFS